MRLAMIANEPGAFILPVERGEELLDLLNGNEVDVTMDEHQRSLHLVGVKDGTPGTIKISLDPRWPAEGEGPLLHLEHPQLLPFLRRARITIPVLTVERTVQTDQI